MTTNRFLPISLSERQLWLQWALAPGNPYYNLVAAVRLRGTLMAEQLAIACRKVFRRHEALHSVFVERDGEVFRALLPDTEPACILYDFRDRSAGDAYDAMLDAVAVSEHQPFDLAAGPLVRFMIARLGEEEHVLVMVYHHIVADARSLDLVFLDIAKTYELLLSGGAASIDAPLGQISSFASRNHVDALSDPSWDTLRRRFENASSVFKLPADMTATSPRSHIGERFLYELDTATTSAVGQITRDTGVSTYSVLAAVFLASLYRVHEGSELLIGTNVSCRSTAEDADVVGLCINMLPLMVRISDDQSVLDLVHQVQKQALEGLRNVNVPLTEVLARKGASGRAGHDPPVNVVFNHYSRPAAPFKCDGVVGEYIQLPTHFARFDIVCTAVSEEDRIVLAFTYDADLYADRSVRALAALVEQTTRQLLSFPDAPLSEVLIRSSVESSPSLLENPQLPEANYPETVLHGFAESVRKYGSEIAVADHARELTYNELDRLVDRWAAALVSQGVRQDDVVGLILEPSVDTIVAIMSVLRAGASYAPIDPAWPAERISATLDLVAAPVLITNCSEWATEIVAGRPVIVIPGDPPPLPPNFTPPTFSSGNLVYVLSTSGSTGKPKAVAVEHRQIVAYVRGVFASLELKDHKCWPVVCTYSADITVTCLFGSLMSGGCLLMLSKQDSLDAFRIASYKQKYPSHYLKLAPSHLSALLHQDPEGDFLPDDMVIIGGELLTWELVHRIRSTRGAPKIANHYSPCETTCGILTNDVTTRQSLLRCSGVPMGRPIPSVTVTINDRFGATLPAGLPGEITISGRTVTRGYLGNDAETAKRFGELPWSPHHTGRAYRSGDIGRLDPDGFIEFLCRRDTQTKVRGFRVELGEVERVIERDPSVTQAAVVPIGHAESQGLIAFIRFVSGATIDPLRLRARVRGVLPDHMVPDRFQARQSLPLNHNGKLDRIRLAEIADTLVCDAVQVQDPNGKEPDSSEMRTVVRQAWQDALGTDEFSDQSKFFEVGGNSLKLMKVYASLRSKLEARLSVADLFDHSTVDGVVGFLTNLERADASGPARHEGNTS